MGVVITITGFAQVTDDETGKPLREPARLARIVKLRETTETISEYFDPEIADLGVKGGDIRLGVDRSGKRFLVQSTFKAPRPLTKAELAKLVDETTGQWSDGIGEACFDDAVTKYKVTIDLLPLASPRPKEALLAAGADPNRTNKDGTTVLIQAAMSADRVKDQNIPIAQRLIAAGADANVTPKKDHPALNWAKMRGGPKLVRLLLDAGAKSKIAASRDANKKPAKTPKK